MHTIFLIKNDFYDLVVIFSSTFAYSPAEN